MSGPDYSKQRQAKEPDWNRKPEQVNWRKHEREVAKRSGGRQQPGSGNKPGCPGDTVDQRFLRECKATKGASLAIQHTWLSKLNADAMARGKIPLLELRLAGQRAPVPTDWVLLPAQDFEALMAQQT